MATGIGGGISAGDAVWTITGDSEPLQKALTGAEGAVTISTEKMQSAMLTVGAGMTALGGGIVGAISLATKSWADMGEQIKDASVQTGIGAEALSGLSYAAELSGSNLEGIVGAINKMQRGLDGVGDPAAAFAANLDAIGISFATWQAATPEQQMQLVYDSLIQAANGAGQVAVGLDGIGLSVDKFFKMSPADQYVALSNAIGELQPKTDEVGAALMRLGINTTTFMASAPDQQFLMIAQAISQIEDPTTRTALAMDIFGRSGATLIPLLAEGSDGITRMTEEAKKLGITFTDETAARAEAFGDTMDKLKFSFMGVMNQIGPMVADIMEKWIPAIVQSTSSAVKWMQDNEALAGTLVKVAGVIGAVTFAIGDLMLAFWAASKMFNAALIVIKGVGIAFTALGGASTVAGAQVAAAGTAATVAGAQVAAAGAASTVAGAEVAAAGTAASVGSVGFLAGAAAIGAIGIAVIALAPLLHGLAMAFINLREAHDQQAASTESLKKKEDEYIASVKARGVVLDEVAMKEMTEAQKRMYIRQQEDTHEDAQLRAFLSRYLQRTETEAEYAKAKNLMLNENISREEAAYAVASGMSDKFLQELMQADAARTGSYMEQLGAREMAFTKSGQLEYQSRLEGLKGMTDAEMEAARARTEAFNSSALAVVDNEARATSMIAGLWQSLFDWVKGLFASIGNFFTGGGGPPIEARASGGPVNSGQPYLVGEEGPELFVPNGSGTIMPHGAAGGGASVTINLGGVSVRSEADIRNLSERLAEVTARELRAAGAYA